jgi:glycosyltransferase involved in cell wall biosynthesis
VTAKRPIRVLHLRDSPWVDGPGRTLLETATRIDRTRIDYHVGAFVSDAGKPHPLVEALTARGLPVHRIPDRPGVGAEIVEAVTGLLDKLDIDVLHTSEFRANVLALKCRGKRPLRLVSTAHGWIGNTAKTKLYTILDRVILRRFDRVILVSHGMRRRLPAWWLPDRRVRILHNALMTESYGKALLDAPRNPPEPGGRISLLKVGRLSPEKGQLLLLEAIAQLAPQYPGLRLAFAGIGPLEAELRRKAAELGIAGRVDFLGYITDMPPVYAKTDLVVQSSFTEGLPNVMLEVAYLGVPVVATDVGGTREVIENNVSGLLIPPRSLPALVSGIRSYLENPGHFIEMAKAGRRKIETDFTFPARTEAQMRVYEDLLAERS